MLRIVMDSAGDLPAGWAEEFAIDIIPINIHFGERTYLQGVDLDNRDFYRLADESGVIPKTSQPTPQQFVDFYRKIAQPGDDIISVHVTAKLSGTYDSAVLATQQLAGEFTVYPVDSASGSAAMGYMCREARSQDRAGVAVKDIVHSLEQIASRVAIVLTLDTLEYARRSGRVKALQAALASLLNVKPVIYLREGVLELGDRVRTRRKALDYIIEQMSARVGARQVNAAVIHSEDPQAAQSLVEGVQAVLNCKELIITELSIGIAANLGPGTVGVVAYPVEGA